MAIRKVLYVNASGEYVESAGAYETADHIAVSAGVADAGKPIVLDAAGNVDASMINDADIAHANISGLANDDHLQYHTDARGDIRYYRQIQHIGVSAGGADGGKPIVLDAAGTIDASMINDADVNHDSTTGVAASTAHAAFPLLTGARPFSGNQDMGSNLLTGLGAPVNPNDAVRKAYVDSVATGLSPKGNVAVATTANIVLSGLQIIDGYQTIAGDRILVKNQTNQTENGIYIAASGVYSRSPDQDNNPLAEIVNGVLIPQVLNGTVNGLKPFFISSIGTGASGLHIIGTDNIVFDIFTSPTQLNAGNGIAITGNVIDADFNANSGLKFLGGKLSIEPFDFAGSGLIDDGADNLAIDFSTLFNDAKAVKASDLSSNANGLGASILGIEDAAGNFTSTNQEGVNNELFSLIGERGNDYIVGAGGVTKGDLCYVSANDTASSYGSISQSHRVVGMALTTVAAAGTVKVLANDTIVPGVLSAATAGTPFYWSGTGLVSVLPSGAGERVWQAGVAKNATDLHVEVRMVKVNS